ncbi:MULTISPECIES: SCO family protein [Thalassobaculum]|uniref:Protein SCO1/2 n=1 Tax=Thalassobaculum litoreum DSM 18839 TaxID=1123362 RepID=A0A8G2BKW7_9PROT|nr:MULTISPECIES: SCO family protein [Thalassobaculum]SDG30626.1 protein SCO1/2 [Thalassobaculum litoreum DSM 18839]
MSSRVFLFVVTLLTATLVGTVTAGYFIWQAKDGEVDVGGPFTLTDQTGRQVTEKTYQGDWQIVFFGYTYCPDICPTTMATVTTALDALGPLAEKVTPIFITIDPERDTVEQLAGYHEYFHPSFAMLTGSEEQIAKVAREFRVYYAKADDEGASDYLMDHSSITYLLDPNGRYVTHFNHGIAPEKMAETLRQYIGG